jgi:dTDP-4-dehydrorhamnose reductase
VRILVLGGDGMLGSQLVRQLSARHDVAVTLRRDAGAYADARLPLPEATFFGVDVRRPDAVAGVLADARPEAVVNAVGLVKQRPEGQSPLPALEINAVFPHRLAQLCRATGARMVHVSTDCVFSGRTGGYRESDEPDARDVYGLSKLLGEVDDGAALVLRTSILGLELGSRRSLVEWFLASTGTVAGYRQAVYSGLTTLELARLIERLLCRHGQLAGLWHVAADPISKYDLLRRLAGALGRTDVEVVPDDSVACDRSMRADRLAEATGYRPPSWADMLTELAGAITERASTR